MGEAKRPMADGDQRSDRHPDSINAVWKTTRTCTHKSRSMSQVPVYPRKRTSPNTVIMSAKGGHEQTHALQQSVVYSITSSAVVTIENGREPNERGRGAEPRAQASGSSVKRPNCPSSNERREAGPLGRRRNMQGPRLRIVALTAALSTAAVPALPSSAHAWGHGGWGWGGFGVGLAAGALIGGALAAPYYGGYYGYGYPAYAYGYGYPNYGYGYSGYGYAPAYYGSYGYARPYYAYAGPYYHRHWVHRRYHHHAY